MQTIDFPFFQTHSAFFSIEHFRGTVEMFCRRVLTAVNRPPKSAMVLFYFPFDNGLKKNILPDRCVPVAGVTLKHTHR